MKMKDIGPERLVSMGPLPSLGSANVDHQIDYHRVSSIIFRVFIMY